MTETSRVGQRSQNNNENTFARTGDQGRQFTLVMVHLAVAVAAFAAAAIYTNYLLGKVPPHIEFQSAESLSAADRLVITVVIPIINLIVSVFATYFPLVVAIWVGFK